MKLLILVISILFLLSKLFQNEVSERYSGLAGIYHGHLGVYLPVWYEEVDSITENSEGIADQSNLLVLGEVAGIRDSLLHNTPSPPLEQASGKAYNWLPKRMTGSHVQGNENEIAYGTNFSTLGLLFAPAYKLGHVLPMVDLRGHRFDDNTYASNIGLIARYIPNPSSFCQIYGANLYYDYRQGGIGYFQQFGVGMETLGKRWDFRCNLYVPFGSKHHVKICVFEEDEFVMTESFLEEVSYGFNLEVGYLAVNSKNFLLYSAAGPYYIAGRKCFNSTLGGKVRIRPQYRDTLALDLSISHDPLFDTIFQAEIIFYLPLYQIGGQNKKPCGITDRQIYQPVERFQVMPLMRQHCSASNF